jgi:hypothetical protein
MFLCNTGTEELQVVCLRGRGFIFVKKIRENSEDDEC